MDNAVRLQKRVFFSSPSRRGNFFEPLEQRRLLCASTAELVTNGIPESIIHDDGHISYSDYLNLSEAQQAHIDPHMIEMTYDAPIDYDKLLGIPLSATGRGGPEAEELPDFFPSISGGFSIDKTSQSGRTLLRFGTQVNNQGNGPGILISGRPGIDPIPSGAPITSWLNPDGSQNVLQAVYNWSGSSYTLSSYRAAGRFTYHSAHSHFHFDGYAYYRLRHNNGGVPGDYVQRPDGTGVVGEKVGFCLINLSNSFTMENGQSSTTLPGYGAAQPNTGCGLFQGIHVGKADIYSSSLEGQWIDVTNVPNGSYFVEIEVDGENAVAETNDANNTKAFAYNLNTTPPVGGITPDLFEANNTFDTASNMGTMGVFNQTGLTIHWGQDFDFFRFTAASSGTGTVATTASNGNVDLYLYDSNQNLLASSTNVSGTDTVTYSFVAGQTYYAKTEAYNSTTSNNYQIAWNIKPTINAVATDAHATETGNNVGVINVARNGPVSNPLTINFTASGTATRGVDYQIWAAGVLVTGNSFTIGNEAASMDLEIRALVDNTPEPAETVILTLSSTTNYVIGSGNSATVTITDGGPEVQGTTHVWQTSPNQLVFNISRGAVSSIDETDFSVLNLDTQQTVTPLSVIAVDNNGDAVVTMTFDGVLPDAQYRATVIAAGITDEDGNPMLDDVNFDFFQLTGDANHDGRVNLADFNILAANFGQSGRDFSQGDFNYDGQVNLADFNLLASKFGTALDGSTDASARLPQLIGGARGGGVFASGKKIGGSDEARLEQLV